MSKKTLKQQTRCPAHAESRAVPTPNLEEAQSGIKHMPPLSLINNHADVLKLMKVGSASVPVNLRVIKSPFISAAEASK